MAEVDFSFLDKFAGIVVEIEQRLDPNYNRRETVKTQRGRLMPGSKRTVSFIDGIHTTEHEGGFLKRVYLGEGCYSTHWSTLPHIGPARLAYLGPTDTVWEIRITDSNVKLFSHKQIGKEDYEIINETPEILGFLHGIKFPYQTPYNWVEAVENDGMRKFFEWRERVLSRS